MTPTPPPPRLSPERLAAWRKECEQAATLDADSYMLTERQIWLLEVAAPLLHELAALRDRLARLSTERDAEALAVAAARQHIAAWKEWALHMRECRKCSSGDMWDCDEYQTLQSAATA